jgi:hypothetical protein
MFKHILSAAAAASVLAVACAAQAEPDFSAERFKAHVTFLADDLLEGRDTGSRGHEIAARYVAAQFALLGLKPAGDNGTWFQDVPMLETSAAGAAPVLTITGPKATTAFKHGETAIVRGPLAGGRADVDAPLVFVGYGVQDKVLGLDDYKGLDVRGKVVVLLFGVPGGLDSEIAAHMVSEQRRIAAEHGAVGVLGVPTLSLDRIYPWRFQLQTAGKPRMNIVDKQGRPGDPGAALQFNATLQSDIAAALFEGAPKTLAALQAEAAKGGRPKGFALKTRVKAVAETSVRRFTSPEVIGLVEGSDPGLKSEYVVMMGHLDHIGLSTSRDGDRINNGALDNAAGVATLLEAARAFATEPKRPRRSVLIVANTGEEVGLLGADYFARYPTIPAGGRLIAGVDLDMPVLTYDFTDVIAYGAGHSTVSQAIARAGASMGLTLSPDPDPDQATFVRSDHYMLVKAGVPAVMLTDGYANGGKAAWETFQEKHYHQVSDDLSQPILWDQGAKFAKLNYLVARDLADADEAARWYEGDYFGNLFAPNAPKAKKPAK